MIKAATFCVNFLFLLGMSFAFGQYYSTDSLLIHPGEWSTIPGILTSSLIHDNIDHLVYNSAALMLFYFFAIKENMLKKPLLDTVIMIVISNVFVFLIGDTSYYYLGSSNLVYALLGYSIGTVIYEKKLRMLIPISLLGGVLLSGLVQSVETVSYLSHYLGVATGFGYFNFQYFKKFRKQTYHNRFNN